jgi:hypothetical protein
MPDSLARPDSSADSLLARLQRAEEDIALLRQQLAAQAASATQASSRARFELTGRVLVNAFGNSRRVNNADVPQFVLPDSAPGGIQAGGFGMAVRQTTLGGILTVDNVFGGEFRGDIAVDFYGGQQPSPGGRNFPLLRFRTARGILRWPAAEIMVGQDVPLITPIEPVSVAAIGVPEFGTAGNLWLWLPQVRLTVERPGDVRVALQGAVVAPTLGDPQGLFDTNTDAAERSRRPFLQGRLRLRWGADETEGEIGLAAHKGWIGTPAALISTDAVAVSALLPLASWIELRGEAFRGQALRSMGGGGIAQGLGVGGVPVRTRGGWGQVNLRWASLLTAGAGCGSDAPERADLPAAGRLRNNVCEGHLIARPDGPIVLGATYRRTKTTYAAGPVENDHFNLAMGFQF